MVAIFLQLAISASADRHPYRPPFHLVDSLPGDPRNEADESCSSLVFAAARPEVVPGLPGRLSTDPSSGWHLLFRIDDQDPLVLDVAFSDVTISASGSALRAQTGCLS